jgi:hypothetical protein
VNVTNDGELATYKLLQALHALYRVHKRLQRHISGASDAQTTFDDSEGAKRFLMRKLMTGKVRKRKKGRNEEWCLKAKAKERASND